MFTIVCLGDSITCNLDSPSYVNYWQTMLDQQYGPGKISLISAGINGDTAAGASYRLSSDVLAHHPDLVTIMFGHNDLHQGYTPADFHQSLTQIINQLQPTPLWLLTPNQPSDPAIARLYLPFLQVIQSLSHPPEITFIDLWPLFNDQDLQAIYPYPQDYLHPSALGHRLLAHHLFSQLVRSNLITSD